MRVAVVGMGLMGTQHARAWQRIKGVELAAVVSPEPIRDVAGNISTNAPPLDLGKIPVLEQADGVLTDASIDAVDLCIPTYLHKDTAIAALQAGKHVLVEKPMALAAEDCEAMMAAAKQAGRLLMVGHVIRFWPEYLPLLEALETGALGRLHSLDLRRHCAAPAWSPWFMDPAKSGGAVFDLLIHDVDLCLALLGAPEGISATGEGDFLSAALRYPDVPSVTVSGGWHASAAYPFWMSYEARFDAGTLEFASDGKAVRLYQRDGQVVRPVLARQDAYEAELAYFASCIENNQPAARCPMEQSSLAVRLIRALADARTRRGDYSPWPPS